MEVVTPMHAATYADIQPEFLDAVGSALRPHRVYEVTV